MDRLLVDIRHTLRALSRDKGLTFGAALALALGIGATTTLFSIVHGGTRALPFEESEELVVVTRTLPRLGVDDFAPRAFDHLAWSERQGSFEGLAAFSTAAVNLGDDVHRPERASAAWITPDAFPLLGVGATTGRTFTRQDASPGSPATVLIGHELWERRFQADVEVVGRTIRVNGEPRTVVGVMPPGFGFPVSQEVWLPLGFTGSPQPEEGRELLAFGRLADGVTLDAARAEMATIAGRLGRAYPDTHGETGIRVLPFNEMEMDPETVPILYLMLLAVSFVLVIACANVANLLLARAATRTREVAVRSALGASRARIVFQHLCESVAIAVLGGLGGTLIAFVAVRFFDTATAHIIEAFWVDFRVDGTVLVFSTGLVALAGILAGILPAIRASGASVAGALKDQSVASGLRIGRLSRGLVVGEVALACGLLVMSAILVKAAVGLRAIELPFEARDVFTAQIGFTSEHLEERDRRGRYLRGLAESLGELPGARAVALTSRLPGTGAGNWLFRLDGEIPAAPAEVGPSTGVVMVTPGYLTVLEARVLRGRNLRWRDDADAAPVALVNQSWVRRFSPDRDPIGRTLSLGEADAITVVGVVPDLQLQDPGEIRSDGVYLSLLQHRPYAVRAIAHASGDPLALTGAVRDRVEAIDPDLPIFEVATLHDAIYAEKRVLDAFGTLFGLFGAGALFLTVVGLYGVVAFAVVQRTREVGIRMALGAQRRDVLLLVLRQGVRPLLLGGAIGFGLAVALDRGLTSGARYLEPGDPAVFAAVFVVLGLTAVAALLVPARRASAIEPLEALRYD